MLVFSIYIYGICLDKETWEPRSVKNFPWEVMIDNSADCLTTQVFDM